MKDSVSKYNIAIVGGDRRLSTVASLLSKRGHNVKVFGIQAGDCSSIDVCQSLTECVGKSDIIILPLPASKDGVHIISPDYQGNISLYDMLRCARGGRALALNSDGDNIPKKYILGGRIPKKFSLCAASLGFDVTDYYDSEPLQQKNALPTAEGAVMIAMQSLEITLAESQLAIAGFGRIGFSLASILRGFGAEVKVLARSDAALSRAEALGCSTYRLPRVSGEYNSPEELAELLDSCDIIFNTVPEIIFDKNILSAMHKKPLFIELASSPGGFDAECARDMGLGIIYAPSLPGRYAPISAGGYIYDCLLEIMADKGINL